MYTCNKFKRVYTTNQSKAATNNMANSKMSLKLLVDTKSNKVVFAEAGKEFVDFLLHLLSLPVGTVIKLLTKSTMVGCVANLYESLENLNAAYLQPNLDKSSLLNPSTTQTHIGNFPFLLPNDQPNSVTEMMTRKFYGCASTRSYCAYGCNGWNYCLCITDKPNTSCDCKIAMKRELKLIPGKVDASSCSGSGYVKGLVAYLVMDDLSVSPMSMISGVGVLHKLRIRIWVYLRKKLLIFGIINQGVDLLKASLLSKTALTDFLLAAKTRSNSDSPTTHNQIKFM